LKEEKNKYFLKEPYWQNLQVIVSESQIELEMLKSKRKHAGPLK